MAGSPPAIPQHEYTPQPEPSASYTGIDFSYHTESLYYEDAEDGGLIFTHSPYSPDAVGILGPGYSLTSFGDESSTESENYRRQEPKSVWNSQPTSAAPSESVRFEHQDEAISAHYHQQTHTFGLPSEPYTNNTAATAAPANDMLNGGTCASSYSPRLGALSETSVRAGVPPISAMAFNSYQAPDARNPQEKGSTLTNLVAFDPVGGRGIHGQHSTQFGYFNVISRSPPALSSPRSGCALPDADARSMLASGSPNKGTSSAKNSFLPSEILPTVHPVDAMGPVHRGNKQAGSKGGRGTNLPQDGKAAKQARRTILGRPSSARSSSNNAANNGNQENLVANTDDIIIIIRVKANDPNLPDGYGWRKYGAKNITTDKHKRSYYRCEEHKGPYSCRMLKRVQKCTDDEDCIDFTYIGGRHTHLPRP